jgi:hypothetical protein
MHNADDVNQIRMLHLRVTVLQEVLTDLNLPRESPETMGS